MWSVLRVLRGWLGKMAFQNQNDSLTVPGTAGPADPAIVIGTDIPQELRDFYGTGIVSAVIYRYDAVQYGYGAIVKYGATSVYRVEGMVNTTKTPKVREAIGLEYPDASGTAAIVHIGGAFGQAVESVQVHSQNLSILGMYASDSSLFETLNVNTLFNAKNVTEAQFGKVRQDYFSMVTRTTTQAAAGPIPFNNIERGGAGFTNAGTVAVPSTTPITIKTTGYYNITLKANYISGPINGVRATALLVNGATDAETKVTGVAVAQDQMVTVATTKRLFVGDTLGVNIFLNGYTGTFVGTNGVHLSCKLETL